MLHEKNWHVSLSVQELFHPQDFLWILSATPGCRNITALDMKRQTTGFPVVSRFLFIWFLVFGWLCSATRIGSKQRVSPLYHPFNIWTWHKHWMGINSTLILSVSSLTVAWYCCSLVGEVDEIEEDVGWLLSCLVGVIEDKGWELDEELDKPGTTIGTKFSVLHCIRIPFFMRCGFWPLIHSYEYPFLSQSFPSDNIAGEFSRTFIVKNIPNSLTYTIASSCVCTSPLAVKTIVGLHDFVNYPCQQISSPFCWSYASTLPSRQQTLVPQV